MPLTADEKEKLAERIVAVLKGDDPKLAMAALEARVANGDEGEDGVNSIVLAMVTALMKHGIR